MDEPSALLQWGTGGLGIETGKLLLWDLDGRDRKPLRLGCVRGRGSVTVKDVSDRDVRGLNHHSCMVLVV